MLIEVGYNPAPLSVPYVLSFGAVTQFDTFIVKATTANGAGWGEITPLPGYSDESPETVRRALAALSGKTVTAAALRLDWGKEAAMTVSGILTARDLVRVGAQAVLASPFDPIPCAALCAGTDASSAARNARDLCRRGFSTLKIKIGGAPPAKDADRVKAIADAATPGTRLRLDANQQMSLADAEAFAPALEGLPIELWEQPFKPDQDDRMAGLAAQSPAPLMLDESIWTKQDIDRAADLGVAYVKLKLCKHAGLADSIDLLLHAQSRGLKVIFGNGVQGFLGNRIECYAYREAGLTTAIESNGFKKIKHPPAHGGLDLVDGHVRPIGPTDPAEIFAEATPIARFELAED